MTPLRILITNITLATRTGTETYVRDLALDLLRRGHHPVVYSPDLGDIALEMETATVPVVNDLRQVGPPPDVIHGHHHAETLTALLHFPGVPAIGFCHDWGSFWDTPVRHPRVRRYVAVDDTCRDRLIARHGIPEEQVRVILNAVDLPRFPRRAPLPPKPQRALVFSNMAGAEPHLSAVRVACQTAGIALDVIGQGVGACHARPGDILGQYDIVFAKARCALEAMAVGAAVILFDIGGLGGLVTSENFDTLRRLNFGRRALSEPVLVDNLLRELARYVAGDAEAICGRVGHEASLESAVDDLLVLYGEIIAEQLQAGPPDAIKEGQAAAASLRWLTPYIRDIHTHRGRLIASVRERDELQTEREELRLQRDRLQIKFDEACAQRDHLRATHSVTVLEQAALLSDQTDQAVAMAELREEKAALEAECEVLRSQVADMHRSTTMRMANRLRGLPLVPGLTRLASRIAKK